jgi:hypothetical protein
MIACAVVAEPEKKSRTISLDVSDKTDSLLIKLVGLGNENNSTPNKSDTSFFPVDELLKFCSKLL